jgi:hypothetical protein
MRVYVSRHSTFTHEQLGETYVVESPSLETAMKEVREEVGVVALEEYLRASRYRP